ncbi:MAG: hypothetical protein DVB25_09150 [Verrucomicrobia bacterium]|nr:MAG: hypothetical protein DVB25_09150 [Verrucomicrobiota bacterium]
MDADKEGLRGGIEFFLPAKKPDNLFSSSHRRKSASICGSSIQIEKPRLTFRTTRRFTTEPDAEGYGLLGEIASCSVFLCELCGFALILRPLLALHPRFFPKKPFFGLAIGHPTASFGVRFSFFWQAVGAPVPCQKPFFRGNIGKKTNPQHNPKPNTT